ncbi:MAG: prepilin-type N-terminal cleavage/methylation domain-containing protein [bacterium]
MQNGFTLFELLVSIAIIIIVSSFVMIGRNGEEQKMFLRTTTFTLGQNLREYQEKALSGESVDCGTGKNVCGFGINFTQDNDFYTPFVDCSNSCLTGNHILDGNDISLPAVSLGKAKIYSLTGGNPLNIVFTPPDPIVYLNNIAWGNEATTQAVITLCLKANTSVQRIIKVNNAGKIEIQ